MIYQKTSPILFEKPIDMLKSAITIFINLSSLTKETSYSWTSFKKEENLTKNQ